MKKQIIGIIFVSMLAMFLMACGSEPAEQKSIADQIEEADTFEELTSINQVYSHEMTDEDKENLKEKTWEYLLANNNTLNGVYYYGELGDVEWVDRNKVYKYPMEKEITLYFVSDEEIYILPFALSEDEELSDIPENSLAPDYQYRLVECNSYAEGWNRNDAAHMTIELEQVNGADSTTYKMKYYESEKCIDFLSGFIHYEDGNVMFSSAKYFSEKELAQANKDRLTEKQLAEQEEEREEEKEHEKELAKSIPKIGMTASEVRKTSWGSPDKINKDTYEWGVEEQWVYDNRGYVYLEDGVVTSVSER